MTSFAPPTPDGEGPGDPAESPAEAEIRRLRAELDRVRRVLDALLDRVPVGVVLAEAPSGRVLVRNRAALRLRAPGSPTPEDLKGYEVLRAQRPDGTPYPWDRLPMARAIRDGEVIEDEGMAWPGPDGLPVHVTASAAPIRDAQGRTVAGIIVMQDVTARQNAVDALRESEERLRLALRVTNAGTYDFDLVRLAAHFSPELKALFGVGHDDPIPLGPDGLPAIVHPDDRGRLRAATWAVRDPIGPGTLRETVRVTLPDGRVRWLQFQGRAFFEGTGPERRAVRATGTVVDVTEQKGVEERLRDSEERLRLATESARIGLWAWDLGTGQMTFNDTFFDALGFPPGTPPPTFEELLALTDPTHQQAVLDLASRGWAEPGVHGLEFRTGDGRWLLIQGTTFCDETGRPARIFGVVLDVTDRKRVEEELERRVAERTALADWQAEQLRQLAAEVDQAGQRERQRLAGMLHDGLQQVLVAARMQTALAADEAITPAVREATRKADGLLLRAIEASRSLALELTPPTARPRTLAGQLRWLGRWFGDMHGLAVRVRVARNALPRRADAHGFLFDAARELLLNVVKHAGAREARLRLSRNGEFVSLVVEDGGRGVGSMPGPRVGGGMGLPALRQRSRILGGEVDLLPLDPGTRVTVTVHDRA